MRRYLAGAVLLVMLGQSSGAAAASTSHSGHGQVNLDLAALFAPLQSAIASSLLYAVVTGTGDRYAAVHAPPPAIERPRTLVEAPALMREHHAFRPRLRHGTPRVVVMPPHSALDPHHRFLDPLAMRHSTLSAASQRLAESQNTSSSALLAPLQTLGVLAPPTVPRKPSATQHGGGGIKQMTSLGSGTGIEHWWTYEERGIPGIGKGMVNVGTGNLIVSTMDADVPEQGIDLALQRVYNSQSLHDVNGDDGGDPSIFGNRWTNNLDASIVYNSTANTITVYDMDGTACTYTANANAPGGWQPCPGEYATLVPTDQNDCTYAWTKPNGTVYWFHADASGIGCSIPQAKKGQLQEILGRNQNNTITFTYSYNGNNKTSENVTQILAAHSDGDSLTLNFGLIPGTSINELATVVLPNGVSTLQYSYDHSGNLLEVDKPGNNSAGSVPPNPNQQITVPTGDAPETYAYQSGTSNLQEACGPRCTVAMWNNPNNPKDGAALVFAINSSEQMTNWQVQGILNFTPQDQTVTPLQASAPTGFQTWYTESFVYGASQSSPCGTTSSGTTTMCDTDGHGAVWTIDSSNRMTQTRDYTGAAESIWLVRSQTWDGNNNLTSTTDAAGNTTQYGYDNNTSLGYSCCGNMVEMLQPNANDITNGPMSPLSYYSYDASSNVTAYCDPVYNQTNGNSWTNTPNDGLCPSSTGARHFTFVTTSTEPFGCLTDLYKPGTYHTEITYASGSGTCGVGLPSKVQGDSIPQYDGSNRVPTQDFGYDTKGNLTSYDAGTQGGYTLDSWALNYNGDNLNQWKLQNEPTIQNAAIQSFTCHNPDGSIFYTQTPSQWSSDSNPTCPSVATLLQGNVTPPQHSTQYFYDLDGDQVKVITHKGCASNNTCPQPVPSTICNNTESANPIGTTCEYYDGLDRLVETIEPYDTRDFPYSSPYEWYGFRWMNRYIYDLSMAGGGASLTIADVTGTTSGFVAYGNLYKTQEYLPQSTNMIGSFSHGAYSSGQWNDVRGNSFDGLDRSVSKYELAYGTAPVVKNTYDANGDYGNLTSTVNALGQTLSFSHDPMNRINHANFSGTAPLGDSRTYTFDADGREATAANSLGTLSYTYDVDGNKTSITEPSGEHAASLICYTNYPDGMREYLGIGTLSDSCGHISYNGSPSNGGVEQNKLFSYSYTRNGKLISQLVSWGTSQEPFAWTYLPSGREATQTDPLYKQAVNYPPFGGGVSKFNAKTYSYDTFGRVSQLSFPQGYPASNYVYDVDDELAGYQQGASITRTLILNARGELLEDTPDPSNVPGTSWTQGPTHSANGAQVGNGITPGTYPSTIAPPSTLQWDLRSNMVTCRPDPNFNSGMAGYDVYSFDGAGRLVASNYDSTATCTMQADPLTTQYDAENHIETTRNTLGQESNSVTWGPDARHRIDTSYQGGTSNTTMHWDDDTLLFTTATSQAPPLLYIGKLGVMDLNGDILVVDRDQTGTQVSTHASTPSTPPQWASGTTWFTGWSVGSVRPLYIYKQGKQLNNNEIFPGSCNYQDPDPPNTFYTCPGFALPIAMARSDGYSVLGGIVQGARTYDPVSGQWLTPDPYAGDVHDPMSQKPFIWNDNNPVEWTDPTGYCTDPGPGQKTNGCLGGVDWNVNMSYGTALKEVLSIVAVPAGLEARIGIELAPIATSLAERFGEGPISMGLSNLSSGGMKGLKSGIASIQKEITSHQTKIADAMAAGGPTAGRYISSMEGELRGMTKNLEALQALKSDIEKAVNAAAQKGAPMFRDSNRY